MLITLLRACKLKEDESMLLHLRGRDPVSLEVKYHKSCYKSYVRCVTVNNAGGAAAQSHTNSDSVSAFRGKGKKSMLKMLNSNPRYVVAFSELGQDWTLSQTLFRQLEAFTVEVYGVKDNCDINTARHRCFLLGHHTDRSLPPNQDSLMLHAQRANYQLGIYKHCLQQQIEAPDPIQHGWILSDGKLQVQWSTMPLAPDSMLKVVRYSCKKSACDSKRCSCKDSNVECTAVCKCLAICPN